MWIFLLAGEFYVVITHKCKWWMKKRCVPLSLLPVFDRFRVSSFEFRVSSFEFRVSCFVFRVSCFEFRVSPGGEIGRRTVFRWQHPKGCAGSNPVPGTKALSESWGLFHFGSVVSCAKLPVSQHYYLAFGDKMIAERNVIHLRNFKFRRARISVFD